jgi:hypothetical protein
MGKQLLDIYEDVKKFGGLGAQIQLALLTKLPAPKAKEAPDSNENVKRFRDAFDVIRKEFKKA